MMLIVSTVRVANQDWRPNEDFGGDFAADGDYHHLDDKKDEESFSHDDSEDDVQILEQGLLQII